MIRQNYFLFFIATFIALSSCESYDDLPKEADLNSWQTFNISNGLVSDSIYCMLADSKNNIWAGTWDKGLMKYDGEQWFHYTKADGLLSNGITALSEHWDGTIWVGTPWGLSYFDGQKFIHYSLLEDLWITAIQPDLNGDIWVGTMINGLIQLTGGGGFEQYKSTLFPNRNTINCIDLKNDGSIWAGSNAGLYKIIDGKEIFYTSADGLLSDTVTALCCDDFGNVWVGDYYSENILRIDYESSEVSLLNGSDHAKVNTIIQDKGRNIWFGMVLDGATRYDGISMRTFGVSDGLPGITITDIVADNIGAIWFGSIEDGISRYQPPL